tara:strand:+ start:176 stop:625 length:450 start_codon:yes stop_codon:yes gene_type:complete
MARITVEDCLKKIDNQYDLVLLAKERTSQLNSGAEMKVDEDNDKRTVIALREIASGEIDLKELEKSSVLRLRKEPDESMQEEEIEEISNDNFDQEYKGEISKSGVAILPSKRTRKTPVASAVQNKDKIKETEDPKETPLELTEEVEEKK